MLNAFESYFFNSSDRLSGTSSNFTIKKPSLSISANYIQLQMAIIPNSIYTASNFNFNLIEYPASVENEILIDIPDGNYGFGDFCTTLQDILNSKTLLGVTYTVTPNRITGKINFSYTTNADPKSKFSFGNIGINILMGFEPNTIYEFDTNRNLLSVNICDFTGNSSITFRTNLCADNYLEIIPVNANSFKYITHIDDYIKNSRPINQQFYNSDLFNVSLLDKNNNIINLIGLNFVFRLIFLNIKFTNQEQDLFRAVNSAIARNDLIKKIEEDIKKLP